jgi:DNA-directed RNA polymerase II subunit RPB2
VLVFNIKLPNSKYSWNAQVRSQNEESNKPALQFKLNIQKSDRGGRIYASIPKIRTDIPVVILFRALGCDNEKQILNMVLSDKSDTAMSEAFRPSLEEAKGYQTQDDCLDYIAQMGGPIHQHSREQRIQFAKDVLKNDMLPHVGI